MNIGNMKVSTRLASGFGIVFVLMIVLAALAIGRVNSIDAILATINDVNGAKQRQAINFRGSVHDRAIAVRDAVLEGEQQMFTQGKSPAAALKSAADESDTAMQDYNSRVAG